MILWAKCIKDHKIINDVVQEFPFARHSGIDEWNYMIGELAKQFDISRPVILKKHLAELYNFSNTNFSRKDFMDDLNFDLFNIEIFPEKKKSEHPSF